MSADPASHDARKWECRRKQVESLRIPWESMGAMANTERHIAALMIENLMEEVEAWKQAMHKADRDIWLLRKERDEARRIVCDIMEGGGWETKEQVADQRGWDCFKEKP